MNEVRGIIFDMDGLLLDTERLFLAAYQKAAAAFDIDLPESLYVQMIGLRSEASEHVLKVGLPNNAPTEKIIESARQIYREFIREKGIKVQTGVIELLDFLDSIHMPRCVATSTHYELACAKLKSVNLLDRFDHITSGEQVEHGKPAPDIFLKAAEKLSIHPEHCLVLEDSQSGLTGAKRAGMIPILIPDLKQPTQETEQIAKAIFKSLNEFLTAFKKNIS